MTLPIGPFAIGALAIASVLATGTLAQAGVLRGSEAQSIINTALEENGHPGRVDISPNRVFPACATELEVTTAAAALTGAAGAPGAMGRVELRCAETGWARAFRMAERVDGAPLALQPVATGALTLRESLPRGTVLSVDHLILDTGPHSRSSGTLYDLDAAIGRRLRVNLGRGQPLLARHLEPTWHVTTKEPVTISLERRGIRIEMRGLPLADAQLGERVEVTNLSSGQVLNATVTGQNFVSVRANTAVHAVVNRCDAHNRDCRRN